MQQVHLIGRLGADPEIRRNEGFEKPYAYFPLYCAQFVGSEKIEPALYQIYVYDRNVAVCESILRKGWKIYIGGEETVRKADSGKVFLNVKADKIEIVCGPKDNTQ